MKTALRMDCANASSFHGVLNGTYPCGFVPQGCFFPMSSIVESAFTDLSSIGPRPSGSVPMRRAQDRLAEAITEGFPGICPRMEPVALQAWQTGPVEIDAGVDDLRITTALPGVYSATGEVCAPILDARSELWADVHEACIRGRIVLLTMGRDGSGAREAVAVQAARVADAGGVGLVLQGDPVAQGHKIVLAGANNGPVAIPVVSVSHPDGDILGGVAHQSKDTCVRLRVGGACAPATCYNLVCDLPADSPETDALTILSAHLDSMPLCTGALDNLTGVVTALAIAQALFAAPGAFKSALRLVFFTGEEYGFAGSRAYVRLHADELNRLRLVYNLDSLFAETARGIAVMGSEAVHRRCAELAARIDPRLEVRRQFCHTSDYLPFVLAGVPATRPADWTDGFPACYHTPADNAESVSTSWIDANVRTHAAVLRALLEDADASTFARRSRAEVVQDIEAAGAAEKLRVYGFEW